ncbi:MAG TPA: DUF6569 family protein [Bacteroidia bacterium]|nr:DUF6569 family protein [Bacteroidia bacterium]
MKKFLGLLSAFAISTTILPAQYNSENLVLNKDEAVERFSFDKLRIYPITANRVFIEAHKSTGNFKPLKKGLEDGTIKIIERGAVAVEEVSEEANVVQPANLLLQDASEEAPAEEPHRDYDGHVQRFEEYQLNPSQNLNDASDHQQRQQIRISNLNVAQNGLVNDSYDGGGASDQVNKLFIQNTGKDSVFIMAGEVVKGGKQDRVIAMDMVIPPNSAPIDLSVFCVEHGRWTYNGSDAADGFTGHANVANTSVRKAAVVSKNQSEVWSKVDEVTTANDAQTSTGTLNALEKDADYQKELKEYEAKFGDVPTSMPSVIGLVAVTGNRVIGCDMFATPDLFRNAFPDLLKSYASEAITSGAKVTITQDAVDKYIANILDESKQKERVEENGQMFQRGTRTLHINAF